MVSAESLTSCFCNLGCNVPSKPVLDVCLRLCETYNMDEEVLVELWVNYSVTRFLNFDPTVETLAQMENDELKKADKPFVGKDAYTVLKDSNASNIAESLNCDDVFNVYSVDQPSTSRQTKRPRSSDGDAGKENEKIPAVERSFVPSTYASSSNTPSRGQSSADRGKVLLHFGPKVDSWKKENEYDVSFCTTISQQIPKDVAYMYEMLSKQGAVLSSSCESFGEYLCNLWAKEGEKTNSSVHYVKNVKSVSQIPFRTWGRVFTTLDKPATGGKVIFLEGCKRSKGSSKAPMVRLDLSGLKYFSVFPGQTIAVEGVNAVGNTLVVKEIFAKGYAPMPDVPKLTKQLKLYVAAGPFTLPDNLNYQPLWDLVDRGVEDEPNLFILIGPFVDCTHSEIRKEDLKDTFNEFFEKLLNKITKSFEGKRTRVVLVSSNRDIHHDPVYPTPEMPISLYSTDSELKNLLVMPDPCVINVEGLQIGITSVDSVKHLGQQEISNTPGMDRLGRLAAHILSQSTFYPLYPPCNDLNVDTTLWKKFACFDEQPHILILPSDIRFYCKAINECLVVNTERLQKYIFAKLLIPAIADGESWNANNVSCEIGKI